MRTMPLVAVTSAALTIAGVANAQTATSESESRPVVRSNAPTNALEIGLQMGWAQGFGGYQNAVAAAKVHDLVNAGGSIELAVGYRVDPHWLIGVYGSGAEFGTGSAVPGGTEVFSSTAGLEGAYHFLPYADLDPWIMIGSGWRGLWINSNAGTDSSQGMDLTRAEVGVDYRLTPTLTIAPVVGATASMFFMHEAVGGTAFNDVSSPEVSTFLFGGLMGRFDIGETQNRSTGTVARR